MICSVEGCKKSARGSSKLCKAHNGGKKCHVPGCSTNAIDGKEHCKKHGPRCSYAGCTTAPRTGYDFCGSHGGGKLCKALGCTKQAQGATDYCIADGGGNVCVVCSAVSVRFKVGACYRCRSGSSLKQWETFTTDWLQRLGWPWSYSDEQLPCARERSTALLSCIKRPDYVFVFESHVVVLEVDEDYHRYYNVTCEVDRLGKIKDLIRLPIHFVRFNPAQRRYRLLEDILRRLFNDRDGARNATGMLVHFIGYPEERISELADEDQFCYEYKRVA